MALNFDLIEDSKVELVVGIGREGPTGAGIGEGIDRFVRGNSFNIRFG
jgi:hypothetical protein